MNKNIYASTSPDEQFIPYGKEWAIYKQSSMLKPWSSSTIEKVKYTTGIDFPEGTKGMPFELLCYLVKDMPYLIEDIFNTSEVSQKGIITGKSFGKSRLGYLLNIFFMTNFDNANVITMMKYQNQLYLINNGMHFYLEHIKSETGLDLHNCFALPDDLNEKAADIHIKRRWSKNHFTRLMLRSFDKPNKLAGVIPNKGLISYVWIEEPVMFGDTNKVSAVEFSDIWANMKSSIFRWAKLAGVYTFLYTTMNGWDEYHEWVQFSNECLPFDLERMIEEKTYSGIFIEDDWFWRRASRYANTALPPDEAEMKDIEILKERNPALYIAQILGGTYKFSGDNVWTHKAHMIDTISYGEFPLKDYIDDPNAILELGLDWGTHHATSVKASLWLPSKIKLHRMLVFRICNMERQKEQLVPLTSQQILDESVNSILNWFNAIQKIGKQSKVYLAVDNGSSTMVSFYQTAFENLGLSDVIIVYPASRHGKDGIKQRTDWDKKYHSMGIIEYNINNEVTVHEYMNMKNQKSNPEARDEKNQLLDESDSTNYAETHIRPVVDLFMYERRLKNNGTFNK